MTKLKTFKTFIIEPRVKINNKKLKTFSKKRENKKEKKRPPATNRPSFTTL